MRRIAKEKLSTALSKDKSLLALLFQINRSTIELIRQLTFE